MIRVSVIMPVYNGARFIEKAVYSVLAQMFQDWELIIIDDGSTDETPDLLRRFQDPRIITIRQENQGEASARNTGLERAAGEYIGFLDADDLYLPNALANLAGFLDAHPEWDAVFSDGYFCDAQGKKLLKLSDHRPGIFTGNILEPLVLSPSVISGVISTLTRRSKIESIGLRFDPSFVIGPDYDFWIHLSRVAQFGYLDQLTCMYRIHDTNITRTSGIKKRKDNLLRGRLKILNSDWFQQLSLSTRYSFFYDLLVNLLTKDPTNQSAIIHTPPFLDLPGSLRADLFRQIATDHLLKKGDSSFARECLEKARAAWPADRKSLLILKLLRISNPLGVAVLSTWQMLHHLISKLRSVGSRKSKPVPSALAPLTD